MNPIADQLTVILLTVFGIGLLVVDMFLAGVGLPGITGVLMLVAAVFLIWTSYGAMYGLLACLVLILLVAAALVLSLRSARKGRLSRSKLFLKQDAEQPPVPQASSLVGKTGVTKTPLRPSGIAELNGERKSVVTEGGFIDAGKNVRVVSVSGVRIVVEPAEKTV